MLSLYWKSAGETRTLTESPFPSEMELEKYIFDHQELLGDVVLLYRQIRTGSKQGIPDMLGVDRDGRICLVELKNQMADEAILPQALQYAIWAETNPDSIKAIWLESKRKPVDMNIEWDNLDIRVILVAPAFKRSVPQMAGKLGYPVDLFQIRRYTWERDEFLLVEQVVAEQQPKPGITKPSDAWDWDYYVEEHGPDATAQLRLAVEAADDFAKKKGWNLSWKINKGYVGFKSGNRLVFLFSWSGINTWKLDVVVSQSTAAGFRGTYWEYQSYDTSFKMARFKPLQVDKPDKPQLDELEEVLTVALQSLNKGT